MLEKNPRMEWGEVIVPLQDIPGWTPPLREDAAPDTKLPSAVRRASDNKLITMPTPTDVIPVLSLGRPRITMVGTNGPAMERSAIIVPVRPSIVGGPTLYNDVPTNTNLTRNIQYEGINLNTPTGLKSSSLGAMVAPQLSTKLPYRTFSGCDINCIVHVIGNDGITVPIVIANAQTVSYSVHREKFPVRTLGRTYANGYTRGGRTIAGTIVFTMFDREVLWELLQGYRMDVDWTDDTYSAGLKTPLLDQLPPFDITIEFSNEYGHKAFMAIYGVELSDEGAVMSIDDMLVEKTVQYMARDIDILRPNDIEDIGTYDMVDSTGANQVDYVQFLDNLNKRRHMIEGGEGDNVYGYDIPYDAALFAIVADGEARRSNMKSGDEVVYIPGSHDHTGDTIIWAGKLQTITMNEGYFIPSSAIYNSTVFSPTSTLYCVYDSWIDTYSTGVEYGGVPPNMLFPSVGKKVDLGQLKPRYGGSFPYETDH